MADRVRLALVLLLFVVLVIAFCNALESFSLYHSPRGPKGTAPALEDLPVGF